MTRYALRFRDGTIQVRSVADDAEIARFQARGDREIFVFGFSPDGRYLATTHFPGFALTVWDIDRRAVAVNDPGPVSWRQPNSARTAGGSPWAMRMETLLVYDLATGRPEPPLAHAGIAAILAFRPDGAQIAVTYNEPRNPTCRILESETGRLVRSIPLPSHGSRSRGAPTAPRWRRRATIEDLPLGRRHRHPQGGPRRLDQQRSDRGLPPLRHARGQQRLGNATAALGRGPGPARAELDRRIVPDTANSARTDGSSFRSRTN